MRGKAILAVGEPIAILALFLVIAIWIPTFSMGFYRAEFNKYGIPQRIGVVEEQLMTVTKHLTDYMRGREPDLVIMAEVDGVPREFFNDREKAHMVDVKDLFTVAQVAFVAAVLVICAVRVLLRKDARLLARVGLRVTAGFLVLLAVLVGIIALDFGRAFETFHHIFFNNDLWILDPATDLLVNIVPQEFFVDIAVRVAMIFVGLTLAYIGANAAYLRLSAERTE